MARTVVRILVGLLFLFTGVLQFMEPPAQPGLMGEFSQLFFKSHWGQFIGLAQIVAAVLLLWNRYVPVALIILFAFLYNSFVFHLVTSPAFIVMPLVVLALLLFIAWPYRAAFVQLFTAKPSNFVQDTA